MSNVIDGVSIDVPPLESQIITLAHHHRKLLDEAIFHQEIHLGDYCLAQRKRVYDFASHLSPEQKDRFFKIYDGELKNIADDDELHPADAESGCRDVCNFYYLGDHRFYFIFRFCPYLG